MNTLTLEGIIDKYSSEYLICDSSYPLITNSSLDEEVMLYNLKSKQLSDMIDSYFQATGVKIDLTTNISTLSGGQKTILMALLALYSDATNIIFIHLFAGLDQERVKALNKLIDEFRTIKTDIRLVF